MERNGKCLRPLLNLPEDGVKAQSPSRVSFWKSSEPDEPMSDQMDTSALEEGYIFLTRQGDGWTWVVCFSD